MPPLPPNAAELEVLAGVAWPAVNHRGARARLQAHGWAKCGEGDWANVFRSPSATYAARVSAFEPSYAWFVELCRRVGGNPYFPRVDFVTELEGGGQLAILEHLTPITEVDEHAFLERWRDDADPDPHLRAARKATEVLDAECRANVPFWMGIDIGENVMRSADGQIKLVDLLGVGGGELTDLLCADYDELLRILPRERFKYLLEIPHFSRDYAAQQRRDVEAVLAAHGW
ncbi:hypothetical protein [Flindersiella endophytica]